MRYTDETEMPFGMHRGKALANVPDSYLKWLYESGKCYDRKLKDYIEDNADVLKIEINR